jgi:hypothetical protein
MRKAGFDFHPRGPRGFGRLERALRLPICLEQIALRVWLRLLRVLLLRLFRLGDLLCGRSELALRHNPPLLAAHARGNSVALCLNGLVN